MQGDRASARTSAEFKGKKITLMGLGLLGRGVGDAEFLAEAGADLIVTDLKSETDLAPSLARLKKFKNIVYRLGGHRMDDFENRDMILRGPNAPLDSPFIAHARKNGIAIEMDASLFAKLSSATTVGVTGTRGKSTVSHYIYEILKAAGKPVFMGGNERGVATLPLLEKTGADDIVILELDSWQLQGFEESAISPRVAVWTNFMPDHMNYYKNDMERYFEDKSAIARFQKPSDCFITTSDIKERVETRFGKLKAACITDAGLPKGWRVALPGEHNRINAAFALAAVRCLKSPDAIAEKVIAAWTGLPGRLHFLGEKSTDGKKNIAFYDDSNATTPEATIAALRALDERRSGPGRTGKNGAEPRPIVLIAGGSDKELNFKELAPEIEEHAKALVLFKGAATDKLIKLLSKNIPTSLAADMDEAFAKALAFAESDDIILLSPAATSFGIFRNEYDRSDQFVALVQKLK